MGPGAPPVGLALESQWVSPLPLHKYPSLHRMDDALEPGLLITSPKHHPHLSREGGGQPISDLRRHSIWLNVTKFILCIQKSPENKTHNQRLNLNLEFSEAAAPLYPTWNTGTKTWYKMGYIHTWGQGSSVLARPVKAHTDISPLTKLDLACSPKTQA